MGTMVTQADRVMDHAYRRFGWRVVPVFFVVVWYSGLLGWVFGIVVLARLLQLTAGETGVIVGWALVLAVVTLPPPLVHCLYACRGLRDFERGKCDGEKAWRDAVAMPLTLVRVDYVWFVAAVFPAALLCVAQVVDLDWKIVAIVGVFGGGIGLHVLALGIFLMPAFLRPILRAAANRIDGPPPPVTGLALKKRLLFLTPGLSVSVAVVGCGVTFSPGQGTGRALTQLALAIAISAAVTIPVTMLLEKAVRDPIDDLLEGTKRISAADYSTPVPEYSSDELAEVARSFNEAMQGLKHRQQLARENLGLLEEVRASRARIVAASDASRKRIERNLHDGAQQRLVALALDLRMLEESAPTMSADEVVSAVRQASADVKDALAELRDLARGLHPSVLTTDGLAPALDQLAARAKLPVTVTVPEQRFPPEVETAAYFVAAEALANVAKYARASSVTLAVEVRDGLLDVRIADDGIGGATLGTGTGLAGLADRVAALNGTITIDSPAGRGTTVVADIPVDGSAAVPRQLVDMKG